MWNAKIKAIQNYIEDTLLHDKFKISLVWKCTYKVLEGIKNLSRNVTKLVDLKDYIITHVEGLR